MKRLSVLGEAVLFMLPVLLCPQPARGQVQEITVKSVTVRGNVSTDSSLVAATSRLRPGDNISATDVQESIKKLYALGIFSDIKIINASDDDQPEADLVIEVTEYPVVDEIRVEGNEEIDLKKIQTEINLVEDQVVSPLDIKKAKDTIIKLYREKGYYLAKVDVQERAIKGEQKVILEFKIKEGKKIRVRRIDFKGNDHLAAKKLRKVMKTKEKRWWRKGDFQNETFEEDREKLVGLYQIHGFREAKVTGHTIDYDESKEKMFITIEVDEGRQYVMGDLGWEGNTVYTGDQLSGAFKLKKGDVFNQELYQRSLYDLYMLYQEKGYIKVGIEPKEQVDSNRVGLVYVIREGNPSSVNQVHIKGNTKTKEKVIRRELVLKPGDIFRRSALERSQREIYMLNYFGNVNYDFKEVDEDQIDVIFEVEEKATGRASVGAAWGTDGPMGTVGLSTPNLWGNGQNLDFTWDFGQDKNTFEISFTEPWLLDTPTSAGLSFYNLTRPYSIYRYNERWGGTLRLGRTRIPRLDYFKIYGRYAVEWTKEEPTDSAGQVVDEITYWESSVGITLVRDSRDLAEFANKGSYGSYYVKLAENLLIGDKAFHKHVFNLHYYIPTFWKLVLIPKINLGYVEGWGAGNHNDVYEYELFRPGGRSLDGEVRGYPDFSMAPTILDKDGNIREGGRLMSVFNLEYRFPIVEKTFYGLLFFDSGYSWLNLGDFNAKDLKENIGTGFGIRAAIPMLGTLGFDFGYGFNKPGAENFWDHWEYHFQFGKIF